MSQKSAILYFVKYPAPGKVKTRLAKTIGNDQAADIYSKLAQTNYSTLKQIASSHLHVIVTFDPPEDQKVIEDWLPGAERYFAQAEGDLTNRLQHAFREAFQAGYEQVIALGSDTLRFTPELIRSGFDVLKDKDVVIGPATDGGYYLIGTTQDQPELFKGISWSTSAVFAQTIQHIKELNLSYALLDELDDLDDSSNLDQIQGEYVS